MAVRTAVITQAPVYKKPDGHMQIHVSYWIPWLLGWSSFLKGYYIYTYLSSFTGQSNYTIYYMHHISPYLPLTRFLRLLFGFPVFMIKGNIKVNFIHFLHALPHETRKYVQWKGQSFLEKDCFRIAPTNIRSVSQSDNHAWRQAALLSPLFQSARVGVHVWVRC